MQQLVFISIICLEDKYVALSQALKNVRIWANYGRICLFWASIFSLHAVQWNITPLIRRGSNFYFFAALYFSLLESTALCLSVVFSLLPACSPNVGGRQ